MIVAIMQTGINHHGKRQAAMKIMSKLNTINAPVNIDTIPSISDIITNSNWNHKRTI